MTPATDPPAKVVELCLNGETRTVAADPHTPLLWVLRDDLEDQSPKYGCGLEQCGACRVLIGGEPRSSCRLPVGELGDRPVETLRSLAADPAGRVVCDALARHNAGQCGYCLPGIAVTLTALVRRGERLGTGGLAAVLDDHLCRCGSHPRILRAAVEVLSADG